MMEVMSSEDEDDLSSSEEGAHNVENIMLCSFAHACSPQLQEFLHEEGLRRVALMTCHRALEVIFLCPG